MATYYVFKGSTGTQIAVTDDRTGVKLPRRVAGRWVFDKDATINPGISLIIADSDEVIAEIAKNGYFLWPQPKKP